MLANAITNIEVNDAGAGDVDANAFDGEPEEEILGGDAGYVADMAEGERAGDGGFVVEVGLEFRVAGAVEVGLESACGWVDGEIGDALWEEAWWETV